MQLTMYVKKAINNLTIFFSELLILLQSSLSKVNLFQYL